MLISWLRTEAGRVLGLAPDRLDPAQPLATLGFDSLMAVQLRNRIDNELMVSLPMVQFLQGPSVEQLASSLVDALPDFEGAPTAVAHEWEEGTL